MNEKIYYYSKQKLLFRVIIAILILLVTSTLVISAIGSGEIRRIGLLIFLAIVGLGAAAYLILSIPIFLAKPKKEIELNEKGIYSQGNNGSRIGLIPWSNIRQITQQRIENKEYLCVHVRDITPFTSQINAPDKRAMLASNNIALLIDNKEVSDELPAILNEAKRFLNIYGAPDREQENNTSNQTPKSTLFNDLKVSVLDVQVFVHYDSGVKRPKNFEDANWLHEHVFFWPMMQRPEIKSLPPGFENYSVRYFVFSKPLPNPLKIAKATAITGGEEKLFFHAVNKPYPFDLLFGAGNLTYIKLINKHEHVFSNLKNIYAVKNGNDNSVGGKQIALQEAMADDSIHLFQVGR